MVFYSLKCFVKVFVDFRLFKEMYVKDIVRDFYEVLLGQHVLLLVNYDIDAICTCKILQWLFQSEDVMYTLVPVLGVSDLITAFHDHLQDMKYVILVNCGGTIDLVDLVEPEEDVVIFVIDSHRPSDLCNIYSLSQIRLVALPGDDEEIPQFSDIFEGSDDEEENEDEEADVNSDDEEYESRQAKKMRLAEEKIIKRRNKRQWEENKNRIVFEYSQFTYFGRCSSIIIFELLWKISKGNIDVLWWAIIGLTSYLILGDSSHDMYLEEVQNLRKHVDELSKKKSNLLNGELLTSHDETTSISRSGTFLAISAETDMNLAIYRHWTVEASLRHSMFTAVHLKLWTKRGEQRLHQLLAEMGLPLAQSRQLFSSMDMNLRYEFQDMMTKTAESHNMNNFVFSSFVLQYGFRGKFYASDYVYSLIALMNSSCRDKPRVDCFLEALDCLSRQKRDLLETGIEEAKTILISLFRQVKIFMDMKQVFSAGSFLYFVIQEGSVEAQYFSNPLCLTMLARFMLRAYMQVGARRKTNKLPLIASAPNEPGKQTCLIVGVPPITEFTNRNFFGKAFEQAAKQINCTIEMDYFDTNVIRMKVEDRSKFFDSLTALLG